MLVTFKLSSGAKWVSVALYETYITERRRVTEWEDQRGFRDYYMRVA